MANHNARCARQVEALWLSAHDLQGVHARQDGGASKEELQLAWPIEAEVSRRRWHDKYRWRMRWRVPSRLVSADACRHAGAICCSGRVGAAGHARHATGRANAHA